RVDGVEYSKGAQGRPYLVRLEVPDEVPGGTVAFEHLGHVVNLRDAFLDAVLAEIPQARGEAFEHGGGGPRLADADKGDRLRTAPGPFGGTGYPRAHVCQALREGGRRGS